jgi:two-component system phosphate regulon sensor histidine kinase PhoR
MSPRPARLADGPSLPDTILQERARGEPFVLRGGAEELGLDPAGILAAAGPLLRQGATPLRSEGRLLGWLYAISDRYRAFDPSTFELLGTIGDLLGPPIENARLYGALRETSGQLGAVLDSIDSGVLLIDNAGVVRYANARLGELLHTVVSGWPGRSRADLLGTLLRPLDQPSELFYGELWMVNDASGRVLRCFTRQITDAAEAPSGTIEVYSDVTQVHAMDRLKDEFVAAAAHDLKTPVTAVKGYTQIALRLAGRAGDERLLKQLEMINARSDDLAHLMDTLLDMSRIQGGRLQLDLESFTLDAMIAHVIQHFDFDLRRQGRALGIELPEAPIEVTWDRMRVERVLINLIGNALKYSPAGGPVELRARRLAEADGCNAVELSITDHGIGIPLAERAQIFERFYRAPQAVADGFKGAGLGLYICRSIVEAHGGRIWCADADTGGAGTTFVVRLPQHVM